MKTTYLCAALCTAATAIAAADESWLTPGQLVASPDGKRLYVGNETAPAVLVVEPASGQVVSRFALPAPAAGLALSADAATLFVTSGVAQGQLQLLDAADGKVKATIEVGHSPCAPVPDREGKCVFVLNRFLNSVAVVNLASAKVEARITVEREPIAAAATPDGKLLVVANHLPAGAATAPVVSACVTLIDAASRNTTRIPLPNGSTALRGVAIAPDGRYAYVTHTLGRFNLPTTQLDRGWMNTNALSIVDLSAAKLTNTVLLDSVDAGAANPWGVACTGNGRWLAVAHAGTNELTLIDRPAMHDRLDRVARGERVTEASTAVDAVPNDLSFIYPIRQRLHLDGRGPRAVAIAGETVVTAGAYSDTLHWVTPAAAVADAVKQRTTALGPAPKPTPARLGEMLFNDAEICFQHWQSCATCHPDTRADALNWDLLNDGLGNPKQTKSMLLSMDTPPAMVSAIRESPQAAVRAGIRHILFAVRPEPEAQAMEEYLRSIKPVPSPHLIDGKLSPAATRGKQWFQSAGCADCHAAPLFTDLKPYNVGTGTDREAGKAWDTPTLVECWRTAPYLYDGRAATIKEVLTKYNPSNSHGQTADLSDTQLDELAEYVLSL